MRKTLKTLEYLQKLNKPPRILLLLLSLPLLPLAEMVTFLPLLGWLQQQGASRAAMDGEGLYVFQFWERNEWWRCNGEAIGAAASRMGGGKVWWLLGLGKGKGGLELGFEGRE